MLPDLCYFRVIQEEETHKNSQLTYNGIFPKCQNLSTMLCLAGMLHASTCLPFPNSSVRWLLSSLHYFILQMRNQGIKEVKWFAQVTLVLSECPELEESPGSAWLQKSFFPLAPTPFSFPRWLSKILCLKRPGSGIDRKSLGGPGDTQGSCPWDRSL